jgi:hypothetical protein
MIFKKDSQTPIVTEISLKKHYAFMYENFIVSSQQKLFLLLEQADNVIDTLQFNFLIYKYGYPNDEVSHPLSNYGLGSYGLFKVTNSPWLTELRNHNRQHSRHTDSSFDNYLHYVAKFKDVTFEIICTKMEETQLTKSELLGFLDEQISQLVK